MPPKDEAASAASEPMPEAAAPGPEPRKHNGDVPRGWVIVRITKKGHAKVHTGETARSLSDDHTKFDLEESREIFRTFNYKDEVALPMRIAQAQEENGFAEIQE